MSTAPAIADEKYVALTTYKRDGSAKTLPVWIVDVGDGRVGFTTSGSSYKVKRMRNDPRVILQPSDARGNVQSGTEPVAGTAEVVDGAEFERIWALVKDKYGIQARGIDLIGRIARLLGRGSGTDTAVIVTLGDR